MSIVKMLKLKLVGLNSYKEKILDCLHKTGCIQLSQPEELQDTFCYVDENERNNVNSIYTKTSEVVEFYQETINKCSKDKDFDNSALSFNESFFVTYDEFVSIRNKEAEICSIIENAEKQKNKLFEIRTERTKLNNLVTQLNVYRGVTYKFSEFKDTKYVKVLFGTVKQENSAKLSDLCEKFEFTDCIELCKEPAPVICVTTIKENAEEVLKYLTELGFTKCGFEFDSTATEKINETISQLKKLDEEEKNIYKYVCSKYKDLKELKVYADYYGFLVEKQADEESFRRTNSTFVLEGYVPFDKTEFITDSLNSVTDAIFIEFSEPTENDNPPTLTKNNSIIRQAECVTDMYSVPNYKELDPNKVVFFFFMLFMGVIMADIGYGILMVAVGAVLASKVKVDNGTKRLWNVIAISGVFTIIFGILFDSFFGFPIMPFGNVMPSPIPDGTGNDNIMIILLLCLLLGVIQIAVGYFCKAINCFLGKQYADGVFDGLIWVVFFIGAVMAGFNFIVDYLMSDSFVMNPVLRNIFDSLQVPGLIIMLTALLIATVMSGRKEKGFGKFSKGFGTIYGLINIMSDILSYARLFGLMLSGMIIANTFNDIGLGIVSGGGIGYVLGGGVIVIGHLFNMVMGVLGAYIHDCRLQYIEFFSKFYTGEGEKFTPFGSKTQYVYVKN